MGEYDWPGHHYGLVTLDAVTHFGHHCFRWWHVAWRHQVKTWIKRWLIVSERSQWVVWGYSDSLKCRGMGGKVTTINDRQSKGHCQIPRHNVNRQSEFEFLYVVIKRFFTPMYGQTLWIRGCQPWHWPYKINRDLVVCERTVSMREDLTDVKCYLIG